jgi:transcriptional regulator with XRE-family HTH domain
MNFTQFHDRLRLEVQRRIQRGTLSISLLARQTGLGQPHLSNFVRGRRRFSLAAMDRLLTALHISAADLLPATARDAAVYSTEEDGLVPLVSHAVALSAPHIQPAMIQSMIHFPLTALESIRTRPSSARRTWQRFVAVRIPAEEASAMDPLVLPEAIALIDRHYNSLEPYRPARPNLYAVRQGARLRLRCVNLDLNRIVLRPLSMAAPVELIDLDRWDRLNNLIAGRVAMLLNEL